MGLMDFVIENSTLASPPWKHGQDYWASFELYPEWKGNNTFGFRGMAYHQRDIWSATEVVVKALRLQTGTAATWRQYLHRSAIARKLAKQFNELFGCEGKIDFLVPTTVVMDNISDVMKFTRFFMRYDKTFAEDEVVLFEELIEDFKEFISAVGQVCNIDSGNLNAFTHFTFHATHGQMVVCNLKGAREDDTFKLTCPTVHSVNGEYGPNDKGNIGIQDFFHNHVCSSLCKDFLKPEDIVSPSAPPVEFDETISKSLPSEEQAGSNDFPEDVINNMDGPPPYNVIDQSTPPPYETCVSYT